MLFGHCDLFSDGIMNGGYCSVFTVTGEDPCESSGIILGALHLELVDCVSGSLVLWRKGPQGSIVLEV